MAQPSISVLDSGSTPVVVFTINPNGAAAAAGSQPITASTEDVARTGIVTETAPATDTASSGLNGRLQRVAQRLTTVAGQLPTVLGSQADAASLTVTQSTEDKAVATASAASLSVLDDWDESDRAKINIVVGQAGVTAGAGAVAANTPRMTLASDDPAVASLSVLDDWDESDRAKVNPIAGQVGIAGGAGAVSALTTRVIIATDQTAIAAKTTGYKSSVTVTRPSDTTAYAALDVLGDTGGSAILTFTTAGPSSSYLRIDTGRFIYNVAAVPSGMTGFRLHLYNASPTAIADNAAFDLVSGDRSKYMGYIDVGTPQDFGSTLFTEANQQNKPILLVGGTTIYGILQTITAWTPGSADTWTFDLIGEDL